MGYDPRYDAKQISIYGESHTEELVITGPKPIEKQKVPRKPTDGELRKAAQRDPRQEKLFE